MKNRQRFGLIAILGIVVIAGLIYFYRGATPASNQISSVPKQEMTGSIIVEDEMGRKITLPVIPKRIVVLTGYPAEVLCALHAGDRIVGMCNPQKEDFPELYNKPSVGNSSVTPDIEKILELKPDLVIAYQWTKKEIVDQLEKCNIPVLCFRAWTFSELLLFTEQMGKMLDEEKRSQELCRFIQDKMNMIAGRTENVSLDKKPQVFYEAFIPYQSTSAGKRPMDTPWGIFLADNSEEARLALSAGINCVGQQPARAPILSAEWVMEKNPDIIIKVPRPSDVLAVASTEELQQIRMEIMQREGLKNITAVKEGRVYIIHSKMCAGPRQIIGLCYYAKWLHPDLFPDVDPNTVHAEMLEKFWGVKMQGAWGYPE